MELRRAAEYRIDSFPEGFRIEHPQRRAVTVRLQRGCLELSDDRRARMLELSVPIRELCHTIGAMMLGRDGDDGDATPRLLEAWAVAPAVARERQRLQTRELAPLQAAQRALRRICRVAMVDVWSELSDHPYILRDIANFPAAGVALAYLRGGLRDDSPADGPLAAAEIARRMADWRGVFSPDGRPYGALDRTLMGVSAGLPLRLLPALRRVRLPRTIRHERELSALLVFLRSERDLLSDDVQHERERIMLNATAAEIDEACAEILAAQRRRRPQSSLGMLELAIQFMNDFPDHYTARLPGLARRAIRWHREAHHRVSRGAIEAAGGASRPTARPPIDLPTDPRIRFLDSVGAVVREGHAMQHCIGQYARRAVAGDCYLFHVDHEGHAASFEVDCQGTIAQGNGPANRHNPAVEWGFVKLRDWARPLRPAGSRHMRPEWLPRAPTPPRRRRPRRPRVDPRQMSFPFVADANDLHHAA